MAEFLQENIVPLFNRHMEVTIIKHLHAWKPQRTSLEKVIQEIKTSSALKDYTDIARMLYAIGKKEQGDAIKKNKIPAFFPAAYMIDGVGRKNLVGLTGLCFIDIDKIKEEQVEASMAILREDEHVLFAARSISGKGLHILVPYTLWREEATTLMPTTPNRLNQTYISVFKSVATRYRVLLGVPVDKNAGHAEHLCIASYDEQAWYNQDAKPIVYRYVHQKRSKYPKRFEEYEG